MCITDSMKKTLKRLDKFRVRTGHWASQPGDRFGAFNIPLGNNTATVLASDGSDWPEEMGKTRWEHVSVSFKDRCPTWTEMCQVKNLFFNPHEVVVQYHPDEREYVDCHPHCLHLWKPIGVLFPTPPPIAVGPVTGK